MTQPISKMFPKNHEAFIGEKSLQKRIKSLEDRIEQSYKVDQLRQSLLAIAEIIEPNPAPVRTPTLTPDLLACLEGIIKDAPPPTQIDKDRDAIWEMARRSGKLYVLGFLSPKLWQSLEVLFSGIVVSYIQMFAGGDSRSMLDYSRVFKNNCRVPDDWLLKNKRPLLHGREVLQAVLATWQSRAKELPC